MKFTLNWLKQPLDTNASADDIALRLTAIGHEVESVTDKGKLYAPFTIAQIRSTEKHPNADRLKVCKVWTGSEELQIVCGAPNAREGIKVVLSRPGDYIPGLDVTLKPSKIRDVESQGMMCSKRELLLSEEHEGIIELPDNAPVGGKFADYANLNDVLFDVAITPNRGDCASVYGIARDLAASGLGTLKSVPTDPVKGTFDSPISVATTTDACPHFAGRYIRGVKNGPSPEWLQQLLIGIGLRPISALVDITNFFTHDLARPLHVYDANKVKGTLTARAAKDGETLEALNGKTYTLNASMCVIADDTGPLGVGGVIGGTYSGCEETTTDVFLESAWFDPNAIARTGRALECVSDARYRFERGVDPDFTAPAIELATKMIIEMCGGTASNVVIAGKPISQNKVISYDPKLALNYGGIDIPADKQKDLLQKLGAKVEDKGGVFTVTTPSWRPDWQGAPDCVEEVLRLVGYDSIPALPLPPRDMVAPYKPIATLNKLQALALQAKRGLATIGYQETITWSFLSEKAAALYGPVNKALVLTNPISVELSVMRPSILPNLLMAAAKNAARGFDSGALFELGPVFNGVEADQQPVNLTGLRFGTNGPRHWRKASANVDAFDVKGDVFALLDAIGFPTATLKLQDIPSEPSIYHPGQSGQLNLGKDRIARFGVVHPAVCDVMDVKVAVAAFEIDWNNVCALMGRKKDTAARPVLELPDLQPVTRDFAFLADQSLGANSLMVAIAAVDKALITNVSVFDVYMGKGVPEGQKSIAVEVTLQPRAATLTEEEIVKISTGVTAAAEKLGAKIRS